jgi:hypothetical protein
MLIPPPASCPGPRIAGSPAPEQAPRRPVEEPFGCRAQQPRFFSREPRHKAWLLCNIGKRRHFNSLRSALSPTEHETFAVRHISERYAGLAGARLSIDACGWAPDLASLMKMRPSERVGIGRWDRRQGDVAMDFDWLWVMLALGIFIPAGMLPLAMARDACRRWRERRGAGSPSPAYEQGMPCARDDA